MDTASSGLVVPKVTGFTLAKLIELVQNQLWNTMLEEDDTAFYSL